MSWYTEVAARDTGWYDFPTTKELSMYNYGIYDAGLTARLWQTTTPDQIEDRWEREAREAKEKENAMAAKNEQIAEIKAQIAKLNKQLEIVEYGRFGKEPSNGTVYKIEKQYDKGGSKYLYSAIRAGSMWYLTGVGSAGTKIYTWEELKGWIGKYSRVWVMTVREELTEV